MHTTSQKSGISFPLRNILSKTQTLLEAGAKKAFNMLLLEKKLNVKIFNKQKAKKLTSLINDRENFVR